MHEREAQNIIVKRAVSEATRRLPALGRTAAGAARTPPVAPQESGALRAGVQKIRDALLGR